MKQFQEPKNIEKGTKTFNSLLNELSKLNDNALNDFKEDAQFIKTYQHKLRKNTKDICDQLKDLLLWLEKNSLGPMLKQKLKQMKQNYIKEIDRNTRILEHMVAFFYEHKLSLGSQATITVQKSDSIESENKVQEQSLSSQPVLNSLRSGTSQQFEQMVIKERQDELDLIYKEAQYLKLLPEEIYKIQSSSQSDLLTNQNQDNQSEVKNIFQLETKTEIELLETDRLENSPGNQQFKKKTCIRRTIISLIIIVIIGVILTIIFEIMKK